MFSLYEKKKNLFLKLFPFQVIFTGLAPGRIQSISRKVHVLYHCNCIQPFPMVFLYFLSNPPQFSQLVVRPSELSDFEEYAEQLWGPKMTLVVENPFVLIHTDVIKYYHVLVHSREKKVNST